MLTNAHTVHLFNKSNPSESWLARAYEFSNSSIRVTRSKTIRGSSNPSIPSKILWGSVLEMFEQARKRPRSGENTIIEELSGSHQGSRSRGPLESEKLRENIWTPVSSSNQLKRNSFFVLLKGPWISVSCEMWTDHFAFKLHRFAVFISIYTYKVHYKCKL